jgi:hypothetical protein
MTLLLRLLAHQTWIQARADRVHWLIGGYLVTCLTLVPLGAALSLGAGSRAAMDIGLGVQWLMISAVAGWLGIRHVGQDLNRRTGLVVLAGPVDPLTWLLGRALGMGSILLALVCALQLIWVATSLWHGLPVGSSLGAYAAMLWAEGAIVCAMAALLSTRVTPLAAGMATSGLWVAGHMAGEYSRLMAEWEWAWLGVAVFALVPDLDLLDVQAELVRGEAVALDRVVLTLGYGVAWLAALGGATVASTRSRDLA